jgi:hypothetical protein
VGDFDELSTREYSTGYVPTTLLVQDGKVVEKFAGNDFAKISDFVETGA